MADSPRQGAIIDISDIMQNLGNKGWTGTLEVIGGEDEKRVFLFFRNGVVQHARPNSNRAELGLMLYKLRVIDIADLNFVLTRQAEIGKRFGDVCLHFGLVTEQDIQSALVFRGREEVLALFQEKENLDAKFHPGEEPLESAFGPEDTSISLGLAPMSMLMEAARREDEWSRINSLIETEDEIFVRTQQTAPVAVDLRSILMLCDGFQTATEVAQFSPFPLLDAMAVLADLVRDGYLQTVSPLELARAAVAAEQANNAEKALKLFELAEKRGLDRVEVSKRIAIAHQQLGRPRMALKRWLSYAERCVESGDINEAVEAYRSAIGITPTDAEAYARLSMLLVEQERSGEAADEMKKLVNVLKEEGDDLQLREAYEKYLDLRDDDEGALEELVAIQIKQGDKTDALDRLDQLAGIYRQKGNPETAIATYNRMLDLDEECLHGRLQLAETYAEQGQSHEAVETYNRLAAILQRSEGLENSINWGFLRKVYESIVELDASSTGAWKWLAKAYDKENKEDLAVSRYMGWFQSLKGLPGRESEMVEPLSRVIELAPERIDVRKMLAKVHRQLKEADRAMDVLMALGKYCMGRGDKAVAREAFRAVIDILPVHIDARVGLARIDEADDKTAVAARRWRMVGGMAVRAGLYDKAEAALRRSRELDPTEPRDLLELAEALEGLMQNDEAADQLARFAEESVKAENFGLARKAVERIRELSPSHPALQSLVQQVTR